MPLAAAAAMALLAGVLPAASASGSAMPGRASRVAVAHPAPSALGVMADLLPPPAPSPRSVPEPSGAVAPGIPTATSGVATPYAGSPISPAATLPTSAIDFLPGDTNAAAGGGWVAVAGNDSLSYAPQGASSATANVSLASLMGAHGDVRITYDPSAGGWWILSAMGAPPANAGWAENTTLLATARSPAGPWNVFPVVDNSALNGTGSVNDQPKLGMDGNYLALSWQNFQGPSGPEISSEIALVPKAQVETANPPAHLDVTTDTFFGLTSANAPSAPTISNSASTIYTVYTGGAVAISTAGRSVDFGAFTPFSTSGANLGAEAPWLVGSVAGEMAQPPLTLGGSQASYLLSSDDTRPLDALLSGNTLWWSSNMGCRFPSSTQICAAVQSATIHGSGTALSLALRSPDLVGSPSAATAYPAIALDPAGNVVVAATQTSASEYPSAVAAVIPHAQAGLSVLPQVVGAGSGTYTASGPSFGYNGARWGDYSGIGVDPSNGQVWMATESMQNMPSGGQYASNLIRLSYSIPPAPAVWGLSSDQGGPGAAVAIWGVNLQGAQAVTFGALAAAFTQVSANEIVATVPNGGGEASVALTVLTPGGRSAPFVFRLLSPPVLSSLSPPAAGAGSAVTITGTDLSGFTAVRFGAHRASCRVLSPSELRCSVPLAGNVSRTLGVSVTTAGGTSAPLAFQYEAASLVSPGSGYHLVGAGGDIVGDGTAGASFRPAHPLVGGARSAVGYWVVSSAGNVYNLGGASWYGSAAALGLSDVVGMAAAPGGHGYWLLTSAGNVLPFGSAPWLGSPAAAGATTKAVAIAAVGSGYIVATAQGNVFNYGVTWKGSALGRGPIVAVANGGSGGYYLVSAAGNVYAFGAAWHGSLAGRPLASPVVGIASEQGGYVLATAAGNAFNFSVPWQGSALNRRGPIVAAF